MNRLNYNQLYYFYIVATEGSIKAACEKLHLTQPTISGQLKTLEESLGSPLFDRKYRKLELNNYGKEILKKSQKIFLLGDDLISTLPNKNTTYRNKIRIGIISSLPNSTIYDFTIELWREKTLSAHLVHGMMPDLIRYLNEDEIDIILSDCPYSPSQKYKSINIGIQNLIAVGAEKFKHARFDFPKSLNRLPYIAFNKSGQLQQEIDFYFQVNSITPELIGSVDDDSFIRHVTKEGLGFAILPESSVRNALVSNELFKLGEMSDVVSNCWVILSSQGNNRLAIRKLINNYFVKMRKNQINDKLYEKASGY